LQTVDTLDLSACDRITDFSALGSVRVLDLSKTKVKDVSRLGTCHTLTLQSCDWLEDVSTLGKVHTLDISWCRYVRDVSALSSVVDLNLANCEKVTEFGALAGCTKLRLEACEIHSAEARKLNGVRELSLSRCFQSVGIDNAAVAGLGAQGFEG
jgi:hypothetical protein